jgi:hypothetical protein
MRRRIEAKGKEIREALEHFMPKLSQLFAQRLMELTSTPTKAHEQRRGESQWTSGVDHVCLPYQPQNYKINHYTKARVKTAGYQESPINDQQLQRSPEALSPDSNLSLPLSSPFLSYTKD